MDTPWNPDYIPLLIKRPPRRNLIPCVRREHCGLTECKATTVEDVLGSLTLRSTKGTGNQHEYFLLKTGQFKHQEIITAMD